MFYLWVRWQRNAWKKIKVVEMNDLTWDIYLDSFDYLTVNNINLEEL